jgi:transcriptional regulator with XRE-family HTH domain
MATRIARARQIAELSAEHVAQELGLTAQAYHDLEARDDEAFLAISIRQLFVLARTLRTTPLELVSPDSVRPATPMTFDDLASMVREKIRAEHLDPDTWSSSVGWDVCALLDDPRAVGALNLDGLVDICAALGVDWRALLVQ